jgi:hypothetical protein
MRAPIALKRAEMRGDAATGRKVAPGRRDVRAARPRQQRAEQEHGTSQPSDERPVRRMGPHLLRTNPQRRRSNAVDLNPEIEQQTRHHFDVADARHVS